MKIKFIILALFFVLGAFSQERYIVSIDYQTGNIFYYHLNKFNKVDDTLAMPRFRYNSIVKLNIKNVNPFALDILAKVTEEELHQNATGFNFGSIISGAEVNGNKTLKSNVTSVTISKNILAQEGASRGTAISNKFSEFNDLTTNVRAIKNAVLSTLQNPNLDKATIIANIKSISATIVDTRLSDPNQNYFLFLSNLEKIIKSDQSELLNEITAMTIENDPNQQIVGRGEEKTKNMNLQEIQSLRENLLISGTETIDDLDKIRHWYTLLEAADFERSYDYKIGNDRIVVELKYIQSEFSSETSAKNNGEKVIKTQDIRMIATGGIKINTSVALTAVNFGSNSRNYYIDGGRIGEDDSKYFVPNLTTLLNFYPVIGENFNIGGSFGVGIPVSGLTKGINFLLGPSFFFGTKSKISFSGGIAYGPVLKLKDGRQPGDTTTLTDSANIVKSVYDFGYFFGISVSILDVK